jgi:hypothetical protein
MTDDTLVDAKTFDVELRLLSWVGDHAVKPGTPGSIGILDRATIGGHVFSTTANGYVDSLTVEGITVDLSPFAIVWLEGYTDDHIERLGVTADDWAESSDEHRVGLFAKSITVEAVEFVESGGVDPHDRSIG